MKIIHRYKNYDGSMKNTAVAPSVFGGKINIFGKNLRIFGVNLRSNYSGITN
ncbi:MAG: hypothetical protein LBP85_04970 [Prevotellaceae bacterium]|jgi:hypothetical protein|nr:hypothetical protein [Prevotellaceae bacterium]